MADVPFQMFEELRAAYQRLEARCDLLSACATVSIDDMEPKRRELAVWAARESARWLDPRGGSGPANEHGEKLREIAALLSKTSLCGGKHEI